MGIRAINVNKRNSVDDEFYLVFPHRVAGIVDYVTENYRNTGLITKDYWTNSPDQLTRVLVMEFQDQAAFDQYHNDPVVQNYKQHRAAWYAANPTSQIVSETTQSTDDPLDLSTYFFS